MEAPQFTNCSNITIETDPMMNTSTQSWYLPEATDNVGVTMMNSSHESGDTFNLGNNDVTYTVYDAAGLSATCNFVIIVIGRKT